MAASIRAHKFDRPANSNKHDTMLCRNNLSEITKSSDPVSATEGSTDEDSGSVTSSENLSQIPSEVSFTNEYSMLELFEENGVDHGRNDKLWYEQQVSAKIQRYGPIHEAVAEAWNQLGSYAADELQDYDTALTSFRRAVQCENGGFQQGIAFARLGQTYNLLQNYDESIPHLANAIRLFDYYTDMTHDGAKSLLHYQMGNALMNKGFWKMSSRAFKESLELEPRNVDTLFALSSVYWHLDCQKAQKYYARAIKILDRLAL